LIIESGRAAAARCEGRVLFRRLLLVAFFLEAGLLLIVLPWSRFWDRNYFAYAWPAIQPVLSNDFVRGAVSGLGVLNLVAAFAEIRPIFSPGDVTLHDDADTRIEP
jgi:hypothetical protein